MKSFLIRWLVTTIAVLVAASIIPGIHCDSWGTLIVASLILGVFNAILKPLLVFFTLPLVLVTLGLFIPIINTLLLWMTSKLVPEFHVSGFWSAFFGSLVISFVSILLNAVVRREGKIGVVSKSDSFRGQKVIDI
jgi:putative membrane protein